MKQRIASAMLLVATASLFSLSCKKDSDQETNGHLQQTKTYSSDVVRKWLGVQLPLLYSPPASYGINAGRYMAYCGVALYEAVVPGMPSYKSLSGQLNEMPQMPQTEPGQAYHWPTCANAALAEMTRKLFTFTSATNDAVQKLEDELNSAYKTEIQDDAIFERSKAFGKAVAEKVFNWSNTDRPWSSWSPLVLTSNSPGLWWPENNNPTIANGVAYWGDTRTMVAGSIDNVTSAPYAYNDADAASSYYKDFKEIYDLSKSLTYEQKRLAKYYDDPAVNGYPSGASYIPVFKQILEQKNPALDISAFAYAKTGITLFDATIGSMKAKFRFMQERPFQFIRRVIAPSTDPATWWKPFISTPGHPDFPANHATFSGSFAEALTTIFGDHVSFINSTYKGQMIDLGKGPEDMGTYSYNSFYEFANAIAISRVYGGIHTRHAVEEGTKQGIKTAQNIHNKVKFLK
ncbi:vanadium-dependent haloperoxidase [Terrimonas sp. NA20]|uniref:Vanadium-dependent haloperoxidase n=1 Tax=Terrimonas ginsenosidimutans TaxID=2908004 RepID=A0ABS9KMH8_9BACT|nr:vanadium-dependent haloperoxidase [Terrimonas ginsenosidimutans]MCG2613514.1 vanadium-dependent haloperoxidase [Terrimonas ginsenosidimutans]